MTLPPSVLTGLTNVILGVRDMDRSLAFYREALGLAVTFAAGDFVFLRAGAMTLCLRKVNQLPESVDERMVELVFGVEDIHAAYEALVAKGVVFRVEPRVVTGDQFAADFRDPDGHVLSIFGPSASSAA